MSNRSGSPYSSPTDANRHPFLLAASTADGITPVVLEADPTTHALTVGATFSASSLAINDGITTSRKASVLGLTDSNPLTVAIVNGTGDQITSFGGGTQYTDGTTQATPVGTVALGKNGSNLLHSLSLDASNNLNINVNTALPAGTNVIGHTIIDTGSTTAVTQATAANLNATIVGTGTLAVQAAQSGTWNITNVSGTVSLPIGASTAAKQPALGTAGTASADVLTVQGITSMTPLKIDGSGVTQPVSGTFWQATQPVSLATNTPTLQSGSTTAVTQATAASLNATVVGTGIFAAQATGGTASGSSLTANPITEGGLAKTANPTAVADGQVVNALFDKLGKQIVVGSVRDLKVNQVTTITASASETTVLTAVASTFLDVYGCIVTNTSATAVTVAFKDSTAGTTQYNIAVPAGDTRGFMLPEGGAIKQGTVNNNWTATTQSVSSVVITMFAVKNI